MWVEEVVEDATQIILDKNQYGDAPPPAGSQFVMVRVKVINRNAEPENFYASLLDVVGNSNVEYGEGCRGNTIPDRFDTSRTMFRGGELSGNICFTVKSSDISSLVLYDTPSWPNLNRWLFFALR